MKTRLLISILFQMILGFSAQANISCLQFLSEADPGFSIVPTSYGSFQAEDILSVNVQKNPEPVLLKNGDITWGYYECAQCSTEVSTKPEERQCVTCNKPHTSEPLDEIAPAVFSKTRRVGNSTYQELYLVNPGRLSSDRAMNKLAETGVADECPFCGVTDFDLSVGCRGCGAETKNPNDIREYALRKQRSALKGTTRFSSADATMAAGQGLPPLSSGVLAAQATSGMTINQIDDALANIGNERPGRASREQRSQSRSESRSDSRRNIDVPANQGLVKKFASRRAALVLAASTFIAATPMGFMWGNTSYTHIAEVTAISATSVTVEYFKGNGKVEDVVLKKTADDDTVWHMGEQIELYFVKWRMGNPSGGERGNGDVLSPN